MTRWMLNKKKYNEQLLIYVWYTQRFDWLSLNRRFMFYVDFVNGGGGLENSWKYWRLK